MPLFTRRQQKKLETIIKEYYGGNIKYFAYNYAHNIYNIPEVRNAIEAFADIFSTIPMYHKRIDKNGNVTYLEDSLSRILTIKPNPLQNASQFWKTVIISLLLDSNRFIEPIFSNITGELLYLFPIPFRHFELLIENNEAYVVFHESSRLNKLKLNDLIYLNRFNATIGGGVQSNLGLYETVIEALGSQIVNVASPKKVRALLQGRLGGQGQLKDKDKKGAMEAIKSNFDENIQGVAYLDSTYTVTPINWTENDVNRALMQFIINIVYNHYKINELIINFKASETEFEQFVNNGIKPIAKQIEQELTSKLFTQREIEVGHRIELDTFALSISTLQAKTGLFSVASRQGILNIDEMREMIGQPPLLNGAGKMYRVSADTINLEKVDEYQAAQKGAKNIKKEEAQVE